MVELLARGTALLSRAEWAAISSDPAFIALVERAILSAEPDRGGKGWRLRAGPYAGRATLGGIPVEIVEKVAGGFDAMAAILAPSAFRLARAPSPITGGDRSDRLLAAMLIEAARVYLSGHADCLYQVENLQGSLITGTLDVRRTVSLRARGMRHKVAFRRSILSDDTPLNRAVHAALALLATPAAATSLGVDIAAPARALLTMFGDSALASVQADLDAHLSAAAEGAETADTPIERRECALLAFAILSGAAPSRHLGADGEVPRSFFVNLESLFQKFVEATVRTAAGMSWQVGNAACWPGLEAPPPLFIGVTNRYLSNPDVVVVSKSRTMLIDAKYKNLDGHPDASDIHQLVAHAAACFSTQAVLLYPGSSAYLPRRIGRAVTGCEVWFAEMDFRRPVESVRAILDEVGGPTISDHGAVRASATIPLSQPQSTGGPATIR